jgi:rRNA-processing protein FCF1
VNEYALQLIQKYRTKGVLIDTNLLLLYVMGTYDPQRISDFSKTCDFTTEDFELLNRVIGQFPKVFTTPHILTEVSDFAAQYKSTQKAKINADLFTVFATLIGGLEELYKESSDIAKHPAFLQLGLADAAIVSFENKYLVLTNDGPLVGYLRNNGIDAVNLDDLKE